MPVFYSEGSLAPSSTPKLEDYPLLVVQDCLFNIITAILHIWRLSPLSTSWGWDMPWQQGNQLLK